jgi:hypothetical protein
MGQEHVTGPGDRAMAEAMRQVRWLLPLALLCVSGNAEAFCRMTTEQPERQNCPDVCYTEGTPLAWRIFDLNYTFNEEGFPDVSVAELTEVYEQAFGAWEDIECDGESIGFDIRKTSGTTSSGVNAEGSNPAKNINSILYIPADEWTEAMYSSAAFALTSTWFVPSTGQIVGADTYYNGAMTFEVCPDRGCPLGVTDIRNVATHEAGHFLGLAHSQDERSTMWCGAGTDDLSKRTLAPDDIAGLCAAYPPAERGLPEPPLAAKDNGCSAVAAGRPTGGTGSWVLLALAGIGCLTWVRARTARKNGRSKPVA